VAVAKVLRGDHDVTISLTDGSTHHFEHVVFACHADTTLALLADARDDERRLLGAFRYQPNRAVLHTDVSLLPRRRRLWSSWNYMDVGGGDAGLTVSYWMNSLQPLSTPTPYVVTLNPPPSLDPGKIIRTADYAHPQFDAGALRAQREIWRLQGRQNTWFAGAWCGSGFHEDGLQAGLHVAERLGGVRRPWTVANPSGRIVTGPDPTQDQLSRHERAA
jgi:predicted NAD/FAD-binding protein